MDDRSQDFLSAALRHVRDAEHLALAGEGTSLDQSYHLAGFGPECARKATLSKSTYDKAIGHGVGASSEVALRIALALDPGPHRYDLQGWGGRYPALAAWSENARYERSGTRSSTDVEALVREAREIVDRLVIALWMDGVLPREFPW
jgi:hypothetical protein